MLPHSFVPVLRVGRNKRGRDFVVGDLHGVIHLLAAALEAVDFDPECDRLFICGDLVDRGEDSPACVRLLDAAWVFSVRGNHEQMALDSFDAQGNLIIDPLSMTAFLNNGLGWWLALSPAERLKLLQRIACLPVVIEIETPRGLVGIVHADVPPGLSWPQFTRKIEALDEHTLSTALWGRQRIQAGAKVGVSGVGRVFVGHTPQWMGLRRYGNVYAVDTGAVYGALGQVEGGQLTMANMLTGTAALTQPRPPVALLNVVDEVPPTSMFGQGPGYTTSDSWNWLNNWRKSTS
jgi:serine/threonine protein phosphatase 1